MQSFEERHRDNISRAKLVLIVVCLIAIPLTFWVNHQDVGSVNSRVTKVESPCLKYGAKSEQCKAAFEQAVLTITHPEACAILRKAGLEVQECAGARLKQEHKRGSERAATKRDAAQKGVVDSNGHAPSSQPGPPSHGGHQGHGHASPHNAPSHNAPPHNPPPSEPAPVAPAPVVPAPPPAPGNSGSTPGADKGVKACVESVVSACVKAETPELPLHP